MKILFSFITLITISLFVFSSCYKDNKEDLYKNFPLPECDTTTLTVSYTSHILPILQANCALSGCHFGSSPEQGIDFSRYADARTVALNGKMVGRITATSGTIMPPTGSLSDCDINLIKAWVNAGAPEN